MESLNDWRLYPALGAGFLLFRTTFWRLLLLKIVQVLRKEGALMDSGHTFFDNRKVGTFPPITLDGLRFVWGIEGGDDYKFCSRC